MLIRAFGGVAKGKIQNYNPAQAVVILRGGAMEWVSVRLKADARLTQSATTISLGVPVSLTYIKEMGTNPRSLSRAKKVPPLGGEGLCAIKSKLFALKAISGHDHKIFKPAAFGERHSLIKTVIKRGSIVTVARYRDAAAHIVYIRKYLL